MVCNMWTGLCVIWICVQAAIGVTVDDGSMLPPGVTYPPSWVRQCGNGSRDIPLFREKGEEFKRCMVNQVNSSTIQDEVAYAQQHDNMTNFIKNLCMKQTSVENCLDTFVSSIRHCFESDHQERLDTSVRIVKTVMDFVCYREGERVLIFLKSDGIDCVTENQQEIGSCLNKSVQAFHNMDPNIQGQLEAFRSLKFNNETCTLMHDSRTCIANAMMKCSDREPSNVVDSLLKAIIKATPCWSGSQSTTAFSIGQLLVMAFVTFLLSRVS